MEKKITKLSQGAIDALVAIKDAGKPITAYELKEAGLGDLNPAHLKALENRGLLTAEPVILEVWQKVKRKVNQYTITDAGESVEVSEQKGE